MTLEARLIALAQAIGTDIKALTSTAPSGLLLGTTVVNVPHSTSCFFTTVVLDARVLATSRLFASFGSLPEPQENDLEELIELSVLAKPSQGAIEFTISSNGCFGGLIPINYLIG